MLHAVAAHLLSARAEERVHITDEQLRLACETPATLEVWAVGQGLAVNRGDSRGYVGWWISKNIP